MRDYRYKSNVQVLMLALAELMSPGRTEEAMQIVQELLKRGTEQTMHIPIHVRQKREGV